MNHEKLHCYGLLLETAKMLPSLIHSIPKGNKWLEDQMKRALSSAMFNLAEGNGRQTTPDRNRFFDMSVASIDEFKAQLNWMFVFGYIVANQEAELLNKLTYASAMIRKLKKSVN